MKDATKEGIIPTTEAIYLFLIQRVRSNMHVILCMSPIGDAFRNRLRQYPSLINCTTIDWFLPWPREALLEVGNKFLMNLNLVRTITGEDKAVRSLLLHRCFSATIPRSDLDYQNLLLFFSFFLLFYFYTYCNSRYYVTHGNCLINCKLVFLYVNFHLFFRKREDRPQRCLSYRFRRECAMLSLLPSRLFTTSWHNFPVEWRRR